MNTGAKTAEEIYSQEMEYEGAPRRSRYFKLGFISALKRDPDADLRRFNDRTFFSCLEQAEAFLLGAHEGENHIKYKEWETMHSIYTFDYFLEDLEQLATQYNASEYCDSYSELDDRTKHEIKGIYKTIDNFQQVKAHEITRQIATHGDGYAGEDAKEGDVLWFDGEVLCNKDTLETWYRQALDDNDGKQLDWLECAKMARDSLVIDEFERIEKKVKVKA